jgi:hypothetical protein
MSECVVKRGELGCGGSETGMFQMSEHLIEFVLARFSVVFGYEVIIDIFTDFVSLRKLSTSCVSYANTTSSDGVRFI